MAFEGLSEKLSATFKRLRGKGRLTEADVREGMREVRLALLEADVSYKVVKDFVAQVTERCIGADVLDSLTPAQQIVKIVNEELVQLMGGTNAKLTFASKGPTVVMMVGLQGAGKTTNGAKLAGLMRRQFGKRPLLVACDVYRPAAITQLQFCDIYARYADEGYTDLVYLSINAGGSSTYNNAVKAMELLEEERPGYTMKIQVIDSHTYSMPYGWYFCECARKVRNGGELASCVAELKQKLDCVEICLAAYSLKQMKKSGRVSAAAAVVGDLLGIRPIISLNAGVSKVESKVRGDAAVPAAMIKWVESRVDSMKDTPYMVAYTSSTAKRDELVKLCKKAFGHAPLIVFQLGGVVSANTGPDGIAIVYEGKPRNLEAYAPELP